MKAIFLQDKSKEYKLFQYEALSELKKEFENRGIIIGYDARIGSNARIGYDASIGYDARIGSSAIV